MSDRLRCVVTGAASGIGAAVVRRLKWSGAEVVSVDLKPPADEFDGHVPCDLTDRSSIDAALAELGDGWHGLCNSAGVPGTFPPATVLAVNFLGLRHLTEGMIPRLLPGGAIVNVGSTAGQQWADRRALIRTLLDTPTFEEGLNWWEEHRAGLVPYDFSKEAVTLYTFAAALRIWRLGRRINVVSPGPVRTPILPEFESSMGKALLDSVAGIIGRHAEPDDIAGPVAFLLSRDAGWLNGVNLVADGGFMAMIHSGVGPV